MEYYQVIKVREGIYRITSKENVYMDLLIGSSKAALIDTGYGFGNVRKVVERLTELPIIVINTHGHPDHMGGNYRFQDVPVYMNEQDWALAEYFADKEVLKGTIAMAKDMPLSWETGERGNALPEDFEEEVYLNQKLPAMCNLKEGMVFDLGGITLRAIAVPGHTCGSMALLHEETGELYLGDAIGKMVLLIRGSASLAEYQKTTQKVQELEIAGFYGGHAEPLGQKALLEPAIDCAKNIKACSIVDVPSSMEKDAMEHHFIRAGFGQEDIPQAEFAAIVMDDEHYQEAMK